MNRQPTLVAVVESPWLTAPSQWPWPIADAKVISHVRLHLETPDDHVGAVVAQLLTSNQIDAEGDVRQVLQRIVDATSLILPGGIGARDAGGEPIMPSCCCGLEGWREWLAVPKSRKSPWLGHDPSPWVECDDIRVRVWSDGGMKQPAEAYCVEFTTAQFADGLVAVHRDLKDFLTRLDSWAASIGVGGAQCLVDKFDSVFQIHREPNGWHAQAPGYE
jgi:hypothetical protein